MRTLLMWVHGHLAHSPREYDMTFLVERSLCKELPKQLVLAFVGFVVQFALDSTRQHQCRGLSLGLPLRWRYKFRAREPRGR